MITTAPMTLGVKRRTDTKTITVYENNSHYKDNMNVYNR